MGADLFFSCNSDGERVDLEPLMGAVLDDKTVSKQCTGMHCTKHIKLSLPEEV